MKKASSFLVALLLVSAAASILTGCSSETKADPMILDSMNKQRGAQAPGAAPAGAAADGQAPGVPTK